MICVKGFFKRLTARAEYPFVKARLYIDDNLKGEVFLLVDTGAGATSLSYRDALRLSLSAATRRGPRQKVIG